MPEFINLHVCWSFSCLSLFCQDHASHTDNELEKSWACLSRSATWAVYRSFMQDLSKNYNVFRPFLYILHKFCSKFMKNLFQRMQKLWKDQESWSCSCSKMSEILCKFYYHSMGLHIKFMQILCSLWRVYIQHKHAWYAKNIHPRHCWCGQIRLR